MELDLFSSSTDLSFENKEKAEENKVSVKTSLDLACGTGVLCEILHGKGIEACGMDFSEAILILSSVIHEIYSYDREPDRTILKLLNMGFDAIAIRDMFVSDNLEKEMVLMSDVAMDAFKNSYQAFVEKDLAKDELLAGKSSKIEWIKPVFADDILTSTCTVSNLTKRNEKNGIVELTFEVFNQNCELVMTNITQMIVKCKIKK